MKKATLALALTVLGTGYAAAQTQTITKNRFGCHAKEVTERLFQLVQAGDENGFGQLLQASLHSGECKGWKTGEEVVLESRTVGYACLQPTVGGGQCYWTPVSAIDK
ncbi:hypothetical protein [Methylobacterium sp. J-076]|uniref:hypothetical protein n=1 Tax=Methylobacterium sp. J-076 TaxID=2836655 RepID=UPI001FB90125|nr:hypothetical protein [Methylobacterium sp. J-076]MCJ2015243.1 hypothetical protein [Methylobacterium sp. J-076]